MGHNPAVVGTDTGIKLGEGHAKFSFTITGWPKVRHGELELDPSHGFATAAMDDGAWVISFVHLFGRKIGARGKPVKGELRFSYSFDAPLEEGETWNPDYAPPQKLIDFVTEFENRLSGRAEAGS